MAISCWARISHLACGCRLAGMWTWANTRVTRCAANAWKKLRTPARFLQATPLFLTIAETIGAQPHEDVSLWYGLQGDCSRLPDYDPREYRDMRWFRFNDAPFDDSDPNLERFLLKISEMSRAA